VAAIKKRLNINHPNLLQLKDFATGNKSEFCSSFWWLKAYFEYPKSDARFQASMKKQEGGFMPDSDMTHMLYNVVGAGAHLQKNGISHGDVTPYNIAVDSPE
jgi:serine/threonine protein kinase